MCVANRAYRTILKSLFSLWRHFWSQFCRPGVVLGGLWVHFSCQKTDWGCKGHLCSPKRRHHGYKLTRLDTFWRVIFNIFAIIFLMCFRGRFLSELCLILESFLELFWGTFCNLLVHCAEMCIFRKSSPLSAFCLVFEVLASRWGLLFHNFFSPFR